MNPEAALKYGLIHHQISSLDEIIIEKEPIPVDAILDSAAQKPKKKAAKKISKKKVTKKK